MKNRVLKFITLTGMLLALPMPALAQSGTPAAGSGLVTYRVTIENLTGG